MLKKIGLILLAILLFVGIGFFIFIHSLKPSYSGKLTIQALQNPVDIYYDSYGIPHIYADNNMDAMIALGYAHAKDRLWQMELVSRVSAGKLSEIFGAVALESDKFYLSLGIAEKSKEAVVNIDKTTNAYKETIAYLKGVNEFLEKGKTPIEYSIIGVEKDPFTLEDIYNVFGYMSYGFAMGNQTDPLLSAIQEKLGDDYLKDLDLKINPKKTLIKTHASKSIIEEALSLSKTIHRLQEKSPVPPFVGSNSWVLSPSKTKNGKVIFANDPHIDYSQPGVWYQAHINTPTTEIYGFYLAMTPYPLLGHNHNIAYGLTMFENDDIDLYLEKNNPNNSDEYLYGKSYKKYTSRTVTIPVKDAESVEFTIKETIHGPVINAVVPQIKNNHPVAMYWVYTNRPNKMLEASYTMSRAKNLKEFQEGPAMIHAPGLNVMYGDNKGNVAWWAAANLYHRENDAPTKLFLDGSNPENHKIVYTPFEENPQAVNPPWNYVYSCNNQPDSIVGTRYTPGYYITQDRAKRVVSLIESKDKLSIEDVEDMILDNTSSVTPDLIKIISDNLRKRNLSHIEKNALEKLTHWNSTASLNSIGTTIYTAFTFEYLKQLMEDELGEEVYKEISNTHLMGRMIAPLLKGKYPIWNNNVTTEKKETNADIQFLAFQETVKMLQTELGNDVNTWIWERVHTLEHKHPLGEIALLKPFFNVGPFPVDGTNEVLNNQMFGKSYHAKYEVRGGPSTRRIIDFSDIENAKAILPTGNSGNFMSPHYKDQTQLFLAGKFIKMLLNEEDIKASENKLELIAK